MNIKEVHNYLEWSSEIILLIWVLTSSYKALENMNIIPPKVNNFHIQQTWCGIFVLWYTPPKIIQYRAKLSAILLAKMLSSSLTFSISRVQLYKE